MATRVEFAVSCTPIVSVAAEASGDNMAVETLSYEIQKSLGGGGSVTANFTTVTGYNNGTPTYVNASASPVSLGTFTNIKFLFIRHTGFNSLGVATSEYVSILVSGAIVANLGPGQAIVLPYYSVTSPVVTAQSQSDDIPVEVMATT